MKKIALIALLFAMFAGTLPACAPEPAAPPAPVEVTREVTVMVTQLVHVVVTATPAPELATATASPTMASGTTISLQSETPAPVASPGENGFNAWCIPTHFYDPQDDRATTGIMPVGAVPMLPAEDRVELISQMSECDFVYRFDQPLPAGTKLSIFYDSGAKLMDLDLKPLPNNPAAAFASSTTQYIIDPPFWFIDYVFKVVTSDGGILRTDNVRIKRSWDPGRCYGGTMPDPVTLACPPNPEAHPWDPYYGWDDPRTAEPPSEE